MMLDISQFDDVFKADTRAHLSSKRVKEATRARAKFGLFFDSLLEQLHLGELQKLYPPHDNKGLRELHAAIVNAAIPAHHKQSLLFYLLCDLRTPEDEADAFAKACYLPRQYVTAMLGFWEMDRQEYRAAMEHLTRPSLLPTFAPEILLQLLNHSKDATLPLAYYHAVSPPLALRSEVRAEYFRYLGRLDVQQAFFASRGEPDAHDLLNLIIGAVLVEKEDGSRADAATKLVDLPLSPQEDECFEQYLVTEPGSKHSGATDTLIMRKIAVGKGKDAVGTEGRLRAHKLEGLDWHVLTSKMEQAAGTAS